jgi:hypothetical protein
MNVSSTDWGGGLPSRSQVRQALYRTKVVISKRLRHVDVPSAPHFDDESTAYFNDVITSAHHYLEYGSGGSTVLAHQHVACLVSVESDRHFLKAVQRKLEKQRSGAETILIPVNIGFTEDWGRPVFTKPTPSRVDRWRSYPKAPWAFFQRRRTEPDVVLVDGRFRVACVLESLMNLEDNSPCLILVDDYAGRPHYTPVEEVAELVDMKGRMAVLRKRANMDRDLCRTLLTRHYADFR